MTKHTFGGDWTNDKLERVRKYLCAYTKIFKKNVRASHLSTVYVDAFAGTGQRDESHPNNTTVGFLDVSEQTEADQFQKGSARIALEVEPSFNKFIFVERRADHISDLESLRDAFPRKKHLIQIEQAEANEFLSRWCRETNWLNSRAVVFLDPYGMQVDWTTIKAIASTKSIDLWLLFPLGVAINRLLTKNEPPPKQWADALTRVFGTTDWRSHFYAKSQESTLFDDVETERKTADFKQIGAYLLERLSSEFAQVAENPLMLMNSRGTPLYLLCFAAGNPKGAPTAVKIARTF